MPTPSHRTSGLLGNIYQELEPTHGRMGGALRTAFAATIAAVILLALQTPLIAPGLYLIYLVSYDVPYLTLRTSILELTSQCAAVATALLVVAVTDNAPIARVLGIAIFTFVSAFLLCACTRKPVAMNFGIFPILTLSLWEFHLPAEQLVHLSMWPIATGAVSVGCKVAIEYIFTRRDPHHALQREMEARLEALEQLFRLYTENAPPQEIEQRARDVRRYAFAGQGKMPALLEELRLHPEEDFSTFTIPPGLIPAIARLMDLGAAFSRQGWASENHSQNAQLKRLQMALAAVRTGRIDEVVSVVKRKPEVVTGLLWQIEQLLYDIGAMSYADHVLSQERLLKALPKQQSEPWLRSDAWTNPAYLIYATKLSLCATICYVIYNALAWPGISTATLTVLVAGLSTTGATNQKMVFRIVGATIGGIIFGIGCIIFVYPYADTAIPFLLSVACVSFIGAWVARSAHFGYVGLQIVFSFYLIAFEDFSAPTQMTPARDRVIGVFLALIVMWLIFHQVHPERTVDKMRHNLARLLTIEADLLSFLCSARLDKVPALREQAREVAGTVRALSEAIPYELDQNVQKDLELSEQIQGAASNAASLFLTVITWPRESAIPEWSMMVHRTHVLLEQGLRNLSQLLEKRIWEPDSEEFQIAVSHIAGNNSYPEPIQNAFAFYTDLQNQCRQIEAEN